MSPSISFNGQAVTWGRTFQETGSFLEDDLSRTRLCATIWARALSTSRWEDDWSAGVDCWSTGDAKEKRAVGALWEKRSGGSCLFVMPKGLQLEAIAAKLD